MRKSRDKVLFREEQKFRQPLLIALIGIIIVAESGFGIYFVLFKSLVEGIISFSLALIICLSLFSIKLITEVRNDGVYVRFFPFKTSKIPLEDLVSYKAMTYSPIKEYGGWGYKVNYFKKSKVYNVSGNEGVRLDYSNGKHIMIGSQKAKKLEKAVSELLDSKK
jgi:hypothetical protein